MLFYFGANNLLMHLVALGSKVTHEGTADRQKLVFLAKLVISVQLSAIVSFFSSCIGTVLIWFHNKYSFEPISLIILTSTVVE